MADDLRNVHGPGNEVLEIERARLGAKIAGTADLKARDQHHARIMRSLGAIEAQVRRVAGLKAFPRRVKGGQS